MVRRVCAVTHNKSPSLLRNGLRILELETSLPLKKQESWCVPLLGITLAILASPYLPGLSLVVSAAMVQNQEVRDASPVWNSRCSVRGVVLQASVLLWQVVFAGDSVLAASEFAPSLGKGGHMWHVHRLGRCS